MMATRSRHAGKTFRFNLPCCPPYNADFDGDEMNLHVLQGEEARAEAEILMKVQENIRSPRFGGPIIGAIHDHISGNFLSRGRTRSCPSRTRRKCSPASASRARPPDHEEKDARGETRRSSTAATV